MMEQFMVTYLNGNRALCLLSDDMALRHWSLVRFF